MLLSSVQVRLLPGSANIDTTVPAADRQAPNTINGPDFHSLPLRPFICHSEQVASRSITLFSGGRESVLETETFVALRVGLLWTSLCMQETNCSCPHKKISQPSQQFFEGWKVPGWPRTSQPRARPLTERSTQGTLLPLPLSPSRTKRAHKILEGLILTSDAQRTSWTAFLGVAAFLSLP